MQKIASCPAESGSIVIRHFVDLSPNWLYALLRLRSDVFIVEQSCAYADIDGRDSAPSTRHLLYLDNHSAADTEGHLLAYLRILDNGDSRALGRVVTAKAHRRQGYARRLLEHALEQSQGPWTLNAQAHLERWYRRSGFERCGSNFDEDGIEHVPMTRDL